MVKLNMLNFYDDTFCLMRVRAASGLLRSPLPRLPAPGSRLSASPLRSPPSAPQPLIAVIYNCY